MRNKQLKDALVIGFALFAMFFGAGNLIFPPFLGNAVGDELVSALLGFLITGVGLPLLGIIACAKVNGSFELMAARVGKTFATLSMIALVLALGPMVAIPRTASTTFELGISTLMPSATAGISIFIFFVIALSLVLKPTSIVDWIGKALTPVLLLVLFAIITKGMASPIGEMTTTNVTHVFTSALTEGYQTMDAMAAVIFASIIISSVKAKGYEDGKASTQVILISGVIAIIGLGLIYGGLMVLGSQTSGLALQGYSRTQLVLFISQSVLGDIGTVLLSISVTLACLTTAVALLSSSAAFFTKLFNHRVPYSVIAILLTIMSGLAAMNDVDQIVALASPALDIIYPVVIVLIIVTLLGRYAKNDTVVRFTVYVTLGVSVLETISKLGNHDVALLSQVVKLLPLHHQGFSWVIPAVVTFIVTTLILKNRKN